jgi:hypothetical protein
MDAVDLCCPVSNAKYFASESFPTSVGSADPYQGPPSEFEADTAHNIKIQDVKLKTPMRTETGTFSCVLSDSCEEIKSIGFASTCHPPADRDTNVKGPGEVLSKQYRYRLSVQRLYLPACLHPCHRFQILVDR